MNIRHLHRASALLVVTFCAAASHAAPRPKSASKSAASKPTAKPAPKSAAKAVPDLAAPAASVSLPIALPLGVKIEFEVDGGQDDVLGMVKAFVGGLEEANAPRSGARPAPNSWQQMLGDKQFSAILKDVRHLHLVVYQLPNTQSSIPTPEIGDMSGMTMEGGVTLARPTRRAPDASFDAIAFHAKPLLAAGGRRNLQANVGNTRVQMFDFAPASSTGSPRGFGLIAQSSSRIIVARSHGYPDVAALGRLIRLNAAS